MNTVVQIIFYDPNRHLIAKHVYPDNTFNPLTLEKSTYYVRDASGNVMATYEMGTEMISEETYYKLNERHIYGSSRLGMCVEEAELINPLSIPPMEMIRWLGYKQYEISNHLGNVLSVLTDVKLPVDFDEDEIVESFSAVIISATDYSPFGVALYGRSWSSEEYRYGFNGKENDSEVSSTGQGTQDYGFRIYNPAIAKFLSVDPLTLKFAMLTPYQFASNTPIQAIDLDGLEAFIVHGTNQTVGGEEFTEDVVQEFKRLTGNSVADRSFRWDAPTTNGPALRKVAAENLVAHIVKVRAEMLQNKEITEDEPISLVGYSHGGNVSIQAAKMLNDSHGIKVNIVTIGTPAKNSPLGVDSDNPVFGNQEDPQGNEGINYHYHIRHVNDMVWSISDVAEDSMPYYSNDGKTENYTIPNTAIELNGPIEAHTKIQSHDKFDDALKQISPMPRSPKPTFLNLIARELIRAKTTPSNGKK